MGELKMTKKEKSIDLLINDLYKKYSNRVKVDFQSDYQLEATLDGVRFNINYLPNNYLLVYCDKKSRVILYSLMKFLNGFLDTERPICFYDIEGSSQLSVVEWAFTNVEQRISDIVNNRELDTPDRAVNIILYNGKVPDSYLDKESHHSNEKKYGEYPGYIKNPKEIEALSEAELYLLIADVQKQIDSLFLMKNNPMYSTEFSMDINKIIKNCEYTLDYLVAQTARFGVEMPEPKAEERMFSVDFVDWYIQFLVHFDFSLTEEQRAELKQLRAEGKDISAFLPQSAARVRKNTDENM